MADVMVEQDGAIGVITLNNVKRRNCLSQAMLMGIEQGTLELVENKARAIILRAPKGSTVFSAGFDIRELPDPGIDPLGYNDDLAVALRAIQNCPVPVIAAISARVRISDVSQAPLALFASSILARRPLTHLRDRSSTRDM